MMIGRFVLTVAAPAAVNFGNVNGLMRFIVKSATKKQIQLQLCLIFKMQRAIGVG